MNRQGYTSILLVDEDPIFLDTLTSGLSQGGYDVHAYTHPASALKRYLSLPADLAILSINLPTMTGAELANRMLDYHYCPILALSAHSDPQTVQEAINCGVVGYHVKPISAHQLIPSIETVLARTAELNQQISGHYGERGLSQRQIETLLDQFSFGVAIIGKRHNILFSNRSAEHYFSSADNPIRRDHGLLVIDDCSAAEDCRRLIDQALSEHSVIQYNRIISIPMTNSNQSLQCWATSLNPDPGDQNQPCATLVIIDPDRDAVIPSGILHGLYGITGSENLLAQSLLNGQSLAEHSDHHGISPHTTKTHLKALFSKTGSNRQAKLVSLLLKLFAHINPDDKIRSKISPAGAD